MALSNKPPNFDKVYLPHPIPDHRRNESAEGKTKQSEQREREMASVSMAAAAVAGASLLPANMAKTHAKSGKRGFTCVVAKAAAGPSNAASMELKTKEESSSSNGRRELVFAAVAAAAAACSFAKVAMADEPERGSPEAKKKYAPICVTMPTARICRK